MGRLMRRMMAPTMTLDTISKIRMVLAVWLMVMRIARWAVFSVQMSFESFRIGTIYLKSRDIVTAKVFLHQVQILIVRWVCEDFNVSVYIYTGLNGFARNLRRRNQNLDQPF